MTRFRMWSLTGTSIAALVVASPALAAQTVPEEQQAQAADQSVDSPNNASEGEEIVVTAQKREEPILKIPQSVTVVSGDTLERQQANSIQDFANLVPGLSFQESNPGNTRIVLRGVNTGGVASTVAVYVDETPFGSSSGLANGSILAGDFDTFDVARLEVLRGPQGTLYGASSLGGVVKYVTNAPKLGVFSGRVRGGIESVKGGDLGYNVNGVINVPLGETVAVRGSGYFRRDAGYVDSIQDRSFIGTGGSVGGKNINQTDIFGGRASLLFQPSKQLSVRLTAIAQNIEGDASPLVEVDPDSLKPVADGLVQTVFIPEFTKTTYRVYNGTIDYDFGFANLVSSSSYAKLRQTFLVDLTAPFGNLATLFFGNPVTRPLGFQEDQVTEFNKVTQEVRLVSPSSDKFEWLLGGFYTKEKALISQQIYGFDLLSRQLVTNPADIPPTFADVPTTYREIAAFGNATVHFTDRFDVTAGARISKNKQKEHFVTSGPLAGSTDITVRSSESVFTYSVAPRYEISDTTAVYARVAKGYRPGGPNLVPPGSPPGTPLTYAADTITSYEAGLKTDIGRRLSFDVSAFMLKWKGIQLFTRINNIGLNINGGGATSRGLEASLNYRPVKGLQFTANGALINAKLDDDTPPLVGGKKGDRLPWVPRASLSLNGDYQWTLTPSTTAFVGAGLRYVGRQNADFDAGYRAANGHQRRVPNYAVLDLRAGADFGRFTVEAFAQNITNSRGITSLTPVTDPLTGMSPFPGGAINAALVRPRTFGLTLTASY